MKLVYVGIELLRRSDRQYMRCIYHRLLLQLQSMELKAMNNPMIMTAVSFPWSPVLGQAETRRSGTGWVSEAEGIVRQSKAAS
jgi:hypothetical protein